MGSPASREWCGSFDHVVIALCTIQRPQEGQMVVGAAATHGGDGAGQSGFSWSWTAGLDQFVLTVGKIGVG